MLKEKLQGHWRHKKSEEIIKLLFLNLTATCFLENIEAVVDKKLAKIGHKTILEEYLNEEEAAEQMKKEK